MTLIIPHSAVPNTVAAAADFNDNMTAIELAVNQTMWADGSVTATQTLTGPTTAPVNPGDLSNKKYVDDQTKGVLAKTQNTTQTSSCDVTAYADLGLHLSFPMPNLAASNRAVKLSLYSEQIGVNVADSYASLKLRFCAGTAGTNVVGRGQFPAVIAGAATVPSVNYSAFVFDNSLFAVGATATFQIWGNCISIASGQTMTLRAADANSPITFIAELI